MRVSIGTLYLAALFIAPAWAGAKEPRPATRDSKRTPLPAKAGVKTPGVQIPFASLKPEAEIAVAGTPGPALLAQSVVLPDTAGTTLLRVDPKTNKPGEPLKGFEKPCGGLVNAFGSLWVPNCGSQTISRVEMKSGKITATVGAGVGPAPLAVAATSDSLWVLTDQRTTLSRIDPATNTVVAEVRLPAGCSSILFAEDSLWIPCPQENRLLRVDPKTNLVTQRIETAARPLAVAFGEASLWVLCEADGKVARIDPKTNKVTATIDLGIPNAKGNIAFGEGSVWVTTPGFPLTRIQPSTDTVVQQFVGAGGGWLQVGLGSLWLTNAGQGPLLRIDPKRVVATLAE